MKKSIVLLPLLMLVLAACNPTTSDTSSDTTSADTSSDTTTDTGTDTGTDTSTATETSTDPEPEPVDVPSANLLAGKVADDVVTLEDAYVVYNLASGSILTVATEEGTALVNYYNSAEPMKTDALAATAGQYYDITGTVTIATGGDYGRTMSLIPTAFDLVLEPSWEFGSLLTAPGCDMDTGFGAWGDALTKDSFGRVYTWTNVKLVDSSYGASSSTKTNYTYFNYTESVDGKNTGTGGYYRLGFYHFDIPGTIEYDETKVYSVTGLLVGTNKDLPFAAGANPSIRVSGYAVIEQTGTVEPEPEAVDVPSANLLAGKVADDVVTLEDAYVVYNLASGSILTVATEEGTALVNYYNSAEPMKTDALAATAGQYYDITGTVTIATGGDYGRTMSLIPTAFDLVLEPSWEFGSLLTAPGCDMDTGFGAWGDALTKDSFGRVYTWTNVKLVDSSYGASSSTKTNYTYFNYTESVDGKNTGTGGYYRLGFYHFDIPGTIDYKTNPDQLYTVTGLLVGTNKDLPFAAGANPSIRVSGYAVITPVVA